MNQPERESWRFLFCSLLLCRLFYGTCSLPILYRTKLVFALTILQISPAATLPEPHCKTFGAQRKGQISVAPRCRGQERRTRTAPTITSTAPPSLGRVMGCTGRLSNANRSRPPT